MSAGESRREPSEAIACGSLLLTLAAAAPGERRRTPRALEGSESAGCARRQARGDGRKVWAAGRDSGVFGLGPVPFASSFVWPRVVATWVQPVGSLAPCWLRSSATAALPFREARPPRAPSEVLHASCVPTALIFSAFGAPWAPASSRGVGGAKIATGEIRTLARFYLLPV